MTGRVLSLEGRLPPRPTPTPDHQARIDAAWAQVVEVTRAGVGMARHLAESFRKAAGELEAFADAVESGELEPTGRAARGEARRAVGTLRRAKLLAENVARLPTRVQRHRQIARLTERQTKAPRGRRA